MSSKCTWYDADGNLEDPFAEDKGFLSPGHCRILANAKKFRKPVRDGEFNRKDKRPERSGPRMQLCRFVRRILNRSCFDPKRKQKSEVNRAALKAVESEWRNNWFYGDQGILATDCNYWSTGLHHNLLKEGPNIVGESPELLIRTMMNNKRIPERLVEAI